MPEPDSLPHSSTPELLTMLENCPRAGYWGQRWQAQRLLPSRMVAEALRVALQGSNSEFPWGEQAGDAMLQLCEDRGLDHDGRTLYATALHHAALADILVSAIRKPSDPAWKSPPASKHWTSAAYLSAKGDYLRRVVLVSHWTAERQEAESRSWYSLGEMAQYGLPMQMAVLVIGQNKVGKRRGPWTQGFLHPQSHELRFRRRKGGFRSEGNPFKDSWEQVWREDHAEISRETWLQAMLTDDVLPEVCFSVELPLLEPLHRQRILEIRERKLDALHAMKEKPDLQLSGCHWPIPCQFLRCCWSSPEREPSQKTGFVRIQTSPA